MRHNVICLIFLLLTTACSSGTPLSEINSDTAGTTKLSTEYPSSTVVDLASGNPSIEAPTWYGEMVNLHDLSAGQCFNRYSWFQSDRHIEFDTVVPCELPHQAEIYLHVQHPARRGAPWPGDREMETFARSRCYENFANFSGLIYELSDLEIGWLMPNRTDFEHDVAQFRGIHCYVVHQEGDDLIASARGSAQ